jgi:hypothetical protein
MVASPNYGERRDHEPDQCEQAVLRVTTPRNMSIVVGVMKQIGRNDRGDPSQRLFTHPRKFVMEIAPMPET